MEKNVTVFNQEALDRTVDNLLENYSIDKILDTLKNQIDERIKTAEGMANADSDNCEKMEAFTLTEDSLKRKISFLRWISKNQINSEVIINCLHECILENKENKNDLNRDIEADENLDY